MSDRNAALRNVAVILAGGVGSRIGLPVPKQLLKIAGKSIIEHTLTVFEGAPEIDEVVVLMTPGHTQEIEKIVAEAGLTKVSRVLEGGSSRNETTLRAIEAIGPEECNVLFHDAVRPLISRRIITDCVKTLQEHEAVDVVIPSADTIVVVEDEAITDIPDRSRLRRGQTPQGFRLSTIRKAYEVAGADPDFAATDDCSVVLRYLPDVPIKVVAGEEHNMKVTQPVDILIADKLFQLASHEAPEQLDEDEYRRLLAGRTLVVVGDGDDLADLARAHGADVFTGGTGAEALRAAHTATGRIDFVVSAGGVPPTGPLAEAADEAVEEALRAAYLAPVRTARAAFPHLAATKGHLLFHTAGRGDDSLRSAASAAVADLTRALAQEWSEHGVRVSCVNPERPSGPMDVRALAAGPEHTRPSGAEVARTSLDVLLAPFSGRVVDVRRQDPVRPGQGAAAAPLVEADSQ
ncbi:MULTISPECIES: bifunctional cytidylyltransferase/SDR family oxidoreductase [unclassified Streptomyces]|uniref:bifunctional cytidylyltransferase/SDR family oxidoreductase n=1 Tax=unclassified Streptomyces TaxID=2593676 RepID=UPI002E27E7FD|nr:bifunctional cytidylyltransferase/SDR family oxidoreductase [Streptomyces sp. NBC_00223]